MPPKYKIFFSGQLRSGFKFDTVVANLVSISNMSKEKAANFLSKNKSTLLKKDLERGLAEKYFTRFHNTGMQVELVGPKEKVHTPADNRPAADIPPPPPPPPHAAEPETSNPYASPRTDLNVSRSSEVVWLETPQKVSASRGWNWIKSATKIFLDEPWKWTGMALISMVILLPLGMVPVIGSVANTILGMVFAGGMMLGAQCHTDGKKLHFNYVFKGFSHNRKQLIMAGVLYFAGFLAIGLILGLLAAIFSGPDIFSLITSGSGNPEAISALLLNNIPIFLLLLLLGMALSVPLFMAAWFSVPLVALNDLTAWTAYKLSFRACKINWLPFLIYGLAFMVLGILLMVAMGMLAGLTVFFVGKDNPALVAILPVIITAFFTFPLTVIGGLTLFTGYRDIFYSQHG